jgi:trans-2-enoyl-CoA reductase
MQTIKLKNGTIPLDECDTKYLSAIPEIVGVKDIKELTIEQFSMALYVEKLSNGETFELPNSTKIRMKKA